MRARLQDAVAQRESAESANEQLLARRIPPSRHPPVRTATAPILPTRWRRSRTSSRKRSPSATTPTPNARSWPCELAELEVQVAINTQRQDEMVDQLEQAVAVSFGPLEEVFAKADLDVDSLIASVRRTHSGQGGPLGTPSVSTKSYDDGELGARFDKLMVSLDRVNLLRVAVGKVPYTVPVRAGYRFTSGFGYRRDPKRGGRRMHTGIDMAGPKGTPIYASADGVVESAERESGYGNVVRIRHDFGFETVYAHQSRIRVRPGQQVSRGEHIGDMGSTGRSTGVHLHYEVHLNGRPVNPMVYLEAAKNVF